MGVELAIQDVAQASRSTEEGDQCRAMQHILKKAFGLTITVSSFKDFEQIPPHILAQIVPQLSTQGERAQVTHMWHEDVAPQDLILADFSKCIADERLMYASKQSTIDLLIRAIPGHAQNRHSVFTQTYPNTTTGHVLDAIRGSRGEAYSREQFGRRSQALINSIVTVVEDFFKDAEKASTSAVAFRKLVSAENQPVAQLSLFNGITVNMIEFLRGFYFASKMDTYDGIRSKVKEKYGHQMGGGNCHAMDFSKLPELGIGMHDLSEIKYGRRFQFLNSVSPYFREKVFESLGVIVQKPHTVETPQTWVEHQEENGVIDTTKQPTIQSSYHRLFRGKGCSDDIAVVLAGFLPQTNTREGHVETPYDIVSRMLGALMADKIDTLEKDSYLIFPIGQDDFIGNYFNTLFRKACQQKDFRDKFNIRPREDGEYALITEPVLVDFTAASANMQTVIHSSQRYFLKQMEGTCALREYIAHAAAYAKVIGREIDQESVESVVQRLQVTTPDIFVTFNRIPIATVFQEMNARLEVVREPQSRERNLYRLFKK